MLDPEYLSYYEDVDWCIRANRLGYRIMYAPEAVLWHKGSASTGGGSSYDSPFKIRRKGRNAVLFMRKNAELKHWAVFPYFALARLARITIRETFRGNGKAVILLIKDASGVLKR